jgi:KUP system potassium uptake protein
MHDFDGDFKFILIDRIMSRDFNLSNWENFILSLNRVVRNLSITDLRTLSLDTTNTIIEKVPITIDQPLNYRIKRLE